eukprot:TRINITY_DN55597_c0_g1_i1.p1 TRINITY_DN55597_c0_g1~~TRINITY_DN55597_c0_g1_i1.p1  ORF type:complete len:201 (-),score=49.02 TRINITY_DN55597_c0_g1_i1:137-739(-)
MFSRGVSAALRKSANKSVLVNQVRFGGGGAASTVGHLNYDNIHLHSPYDYFDPANTYVFDSSNPPPKFTDAEVEANLKLAYANYREELEKLEKSITDPEELEAFRSFRRSTKPVHQDIEQIKAKNDPVFTELCHKLYDEDTKEESFMRKLYLRGDIVANRWLMVICGSYMTYLAFSSMHHYFQHMDELYGEGAHGEEAEH